MPQPTGPDGDDDELEVQLSKRYKRLREQDDISPHKMAGIALLEPVLGPDDEKRMQLLNIEGMDAALSGKLSPEVQPHHSLVGMSSLFWQARPQLRRSPGLSEPD